MSSEKSLTPQIRFKGFTEAWEQRKLGDIATKQTSKNINSTIQEPFTNSAEQGVVSQYDYFDHGITNVANISNYFVICPDDFVYNPRISVTAPCGPINRNRLNRPGIMSPLYTIFRADQCIAVTYLEYYFKTKKWHPFMFLEGNTGARSDRFSISDSTFFKMPIQIPSKAEQKLISEQLEALSNLITLHQRKLDALKKIKSALLEKMFPKDGSDIPEIRFAGFTEAWEQRKLGELMEVTSVRRVHQDDWTTQGVRFLRARDLVAYANNTEIELPLYISKELYEKYTAQSGKVEIGDLLVTGVGTIGVPWLVETPSPVYFKDGNIIWFKNKNVINGKYFYYAFTSASIQKFIKESAGTGTVGTYTIDTGKKTPIYIPSTFEQHKIASTMKRFDSLITLHQRKLDALKKIKSALLEKMFV